MAPQPRTYGTRRSYVKPAGELVDGTTADKPEPKLRKVNGKTASVRTSREFGTTRNEEQRDTSSQRLGNEDCSASGRAVERHAAPSGTLKAEDKPISVSPTLESREKRRLSAQGILLPDTSTKAHVSRRKSSRISINGSATPDNQNLITNTDVRIDNASPSHAKAVFRPNGFSEHQPESPVSRDIDLRDIPKDETNLTVWIARLISKYLDKNPLSAISGPRQKDPSPQAGQDVEMSDALNQVEDVRMTRGKKKRKLQQLKGKKPTNGNKFLKPVAHGTLFQEGIAADLILHTIVLSFKVDVGVGKSLPPEDAATVEMRLKENVSEELKEKLFGSSSTTDVSSNVIELNACGKLLFNTLVGTGDSANCNSAAVLKLALEGRKDDAPFLSALKVLASSSEIMAFINIFICKNGAHLQEASIADESCPSTGLETSGATTVSGTSGLTSRGGTSVPDSETFFKATTRKNVADKKNPGMSIVLATLLQRLIYLMQKDKSDHKKPYKLLKLQ